MGRYGGGYDRYGGYGSWAPYVSVGERKAQATAAAKKLAQKEKREPAPVQSKGRKFATTFWGRAWCDNLEQYSDYASRLPRGKTYLGNGSVADLVIEKGLVRAIVGGSEVYTITIKIKTLAAKTWRVVQEDCAKSIHSALELLQGRFDQEVMRRLTDKANGLFPQPKEIEMDCSCPDGAYVCKHVAAVMYGIGVRLDQSPQLLFTLRNVDHLDLISQATSAENLESTFRAGANDSLAGNDLGELFGIELGGGAAPPKPPRKPRTVKKATRVAKATVPSAATEPAARAGGKRKPAVKPKVAAKRKAAAK